MEATSAHADPMLERAVRLGALMARLPALPTHDWMDRAAAVVAAAAPGATVLAVLDTPRTNSIERVGAAGPETDDFDRDPRALAQRVEQLPLRWRRQLVVQPAANYLRTSLGGRFARIDKGLCLLASTPLGPGESSRLSMVVAAEPEAQAEAVLSLAMPDLAARAMVALGPEPGAATHWLLPADLALIEALVAGKTIPEIARESGRKEHAVQDAIKAMYRRLGRNRRADLVARAVGHAPASELEWKRAGGRRNEEGQEG